MPPGSKRTTHGGKRHVMYALKPCLRPTNQNKNDRRNTGMFITHKIVEAAEALRSISF
jgi:hypothetical protein